MQSLDFAVNIKTFKCTKSRVVCEDHFEPDCFEGFFENDIAKSLNFHPKKRQLKKGAIPTKVNVGVPRAKERSSTLHLVNKRKQAKVIIIR